MPSFILTLLLAAATAPIQTAPTAQATSTKPTVVSAAKPASGAAASVKKAKIATSAPAVITIHGLCSGQQSAKPKADAACTTVVTKPEFDLLVNALNAIGPPFLPAQLHAVAQAYATTLLSYEAAKKAGVERDPRFAEVMRLARMRAMGDMYNALMQENARKIAPEAIEAYYNNNVEKFEELTLRRITLPRYNIANLKDEEFAGKASKVAADIYDRAVKGEDLDKLQKEAFDALGLKNPPITTMAPVRRGVYAADQEKQLFALKPGEVAPIVQQASSLIIFKMESRETLSLAKARDEVSRILVKQKLDQQEQDRNSSVQIDYNEQYVGAQPNSAWMPAGQLNAPSKNQAASGDPKASPVKSDIPK
jgi:PPIC-type PPIASE domain